MQPLFFGNNILHLLPYLKCFFRAGCKSLPAVIVRDSLWGLNRCNSGTDGDSPDERRGRTVVCRYCYDSYTIFPQEQIQSTLAGEYYP